jgi:hypothetical protein
MVNDTNSAIEDAFVKEIGVDVFTAIKILNEAGISTDYMSDITNKCKNVLAHEIEKGNVPYEFRFLLLSLVLCRMFRTSADFQKKYMKSVQKSVDLSKDIEIVKEP